MEAQFLKPSFFESPDNLNQNFFPSPQSSTNLTPNFSNYSIFRTNFLFALRFKKSGLLCIVFDKDCRQSTATFSSSQMVSNSNPMGASTGEIPLVYLGGC